jgi:phosphosulfolactate synthase (CoM biosynthesis protein A)
MSKEINNKLEKQAIGIVAQLFDLAEVPVEKRQEVNDTAYDYMFEQLRLHSVVWQSEQLHSCKYVKRIGESCTLNNNCKYPNCE